MTPTEEQMLRNQTAIMGVLMIGAQDTCAIRAALVDVLRCLRETNAPLKMEDQQGRAVHGYISSR